jgi:hypothetical protein
VIEQALAEPPAAGDLPIPPYFTHPTPENEIKLADLAQLYFTQEPS